MESKQIVLINNKLQTWCQGDFVLGEQWFVHRFNTQFPLTPDSTKQDGQENKTQPISVGIDPGKLFSGIGVQSSGFTLYASNRQLELQVLTELTKIYPITDIYFEYMIIKLLRFLTLTTTVFNAFLFSPSPLNPCCVVNPSPFNTSTLTND